LARKVSLGLVALLLFASSLLALPTVAQVNPYVAPTLSLSPDTGPTGIVLTVTGAGFSAGVTVSISSSTLTLSSPGTITTSSSGGFTAQITVVTGSPGSNVITATGSDLATHPNDMASAHFAISNVNSEHSSSNFASGGQISVNDTQLTGVSVVVGGLTGVSGKVNITTSALSSPSGGVGVVTQTGTLYFDVQVTLPAGTTAPSGAEVTICLTNPGVTSGMGLEYWDGSAWVSATSVTVHGSRVCGTVPLSALTGTNIAAVPGAAAANYTYLYVAIVVVVLVVVVVLGLVFMRRRRGN
jgi:hypothetical protein